MKKISLMIATAILLSTVTFAQEAKKDAPKQEKKEAKKEEKKDAKKEEKKDAKKETKKDDGAKK